MFSYGQVEFERTYYKKASGGYEYLADIAVGINERDRISENMLCSLAAGAKDMSYENASRHITGGKISRQTVMNCVRESRVEATESTEKRAVSEPHISHVLAARLSSRPLAWSETTLKHLAPIPAAGSLTLNRKSTDNEQPVFLRKAAARASKAFLRETEGLPSPVTLPLIHYWHSQKNFPTKT